MSVANIRKSAKSSSSLIGCMYCEPCSTEKIVKVLDKEFDSISSRSSSFTSIVHVILGEVGWCDGAGQTSSAGAPYKFG